MDRDLMYNHLLILRSELIPALGCTEPAAIALAASKARELIGCTPSSMVVACSRNVIKNAKSVNVPNSSGMQGIMAAAILGMLCGNPDSGLQVLEAVKPEHIEEAKQLLKTDFCECRPLANSETLKIEVLIKGNNHQARVEITGLHDCFTLLELDGKCLYQVAKNEQAQFAENQAGTPEGDISLLTIQNIIDFANEINLDDIKKLIDRQITLNSAISDEGILHDWGLNVGRIILETYGYDIRNRARARAAAGSDARMSGCSMPVIINSGSGNQGMTLSLPVIEYAKEMNVSHDKLCRALIISNLVAIRQKNELGRLSAYCGVVSAAAGSGAGIAYLHDASYQEISNTIINTIANVGGMICDGAKPSCAAKISSAVDAAIIGFEMSQHNKVCRPGEGLVKESVEKTIASIGRMGRDGMKETDTEIINIMLEGNQ